MVSKFKILCFAAALVVAGAAAVMFSGDPAAANQCAAACRAAHTQCQVATKGSPACNAQLQACIQGCLSRR